jgi:hypothetical protein
VSQSEIAATRERATHAGVPFASLEPVPEAGDAYRPVDEAARSLLPVPLCRRLSMLPIAVEEDRVLIASAEPVQYLPYDVAAALGGRPVSFVVVPAGQLARALQEPSSHPTGGQA